MLAVPADRLPAAIGDLDPGNRALLDLSLRRGVSDAEIGELLRKEPSDVARGRDAVLELLADALEVGGHDRRERVRMAVAALPDDAWRAPAAHASSAPPQVSATPPPPKPPEEQPKPPDDAAERPDVDRERERAAAARDLDEEHRFKPEPQARRSRRNGVLAVLGLLAVVAALIAVLSSGGDDEPDGGDTNGSTPAQNGGPTPEPGGASQKLAPLPGSRGSGSVTITDEGATINVRGLPDPEGGAYQVWLYDSVVRAKSLGTLPESGGRLEVALPPDASRYEFLDVSLEPADGNANHSGDSVMRTPLGELLAE
jgi:hypothetical protein